MMREKRRSKYIDKHVQGQLAVRTLLHWVTLMLVCCTVSLTLQFLLNPLSTWHENAQRMWSAQGPVVLVAFALLPLFVKDTITFSHRFVGPVVRIRTVLKDLAQGKSPAPVKLRPNDCWAEIADELNDVIAEFDRLRTRQEQGHVARSDEPELAETAARR
jgi:hypothetical protein